ncbi:hypothetical protein SEPCBS119000_005493 [Sporothrix epigloea]|uniref:SCP domain-containing protein n=1 Tax=Sporothrix epigloea TaxID=1892477 RepID=A0ABP0DXX1_9PEZI
MKASFALALTGALLATASPIYKRKLHTDYVTNIVFVTVTVDPSEPASTSTQPSTSSTYYTSTSSSAEPSTTSIEVTTSSSIPPPPAPTTTWTTSSPPPPPPPVTTSSVPVEAVTTTAAVTSKPVAAAPAVESSSPAAQATTATASSSDVGTSQAGSSQAGSSKATSSEPTDFASTAVYHHNLHRSNHSAPAVSWNTDLASYAATVAASCVFAHNLKPGSSTGSYGQNIAVYGASGDVASTNPSGVVAQAVTDMWYNGEVWQFPEDGYGESNPDMSNFEAWGHFSQVVWAATTEIGCASQYCAPGTIYSGMGSWFTVCDYRSQGNMGGEYGSNVLPSLGQATVTA